MSFILRQGLRKDGSTPHFLWRAIFEQLWGDESTTIPADTNSDCKNQNSGLNLTYFTNFKFPLEWGSGLIWVVKGEELPYQTNIQAQ